MRILIHNAGCVSSHPFEDVPVYTAPPPWLGRGLIRRAMENFNRQTIARAEVEAADPVINHDDPSLPHWQHHQLKLSLLILQVNTNNCENGA